ncbi:MAG: alpha-N-arabinofuranosidase [Lachnospiraceae bacterium]|nr:alpha-N-arabinofuranosidase [Lachnospiraceae bacterium]
MSKIFINPNVKKGKINKEIYGHFSEHLGRCIYEGLYVGENSEIPNVNGMRKDVVDALKEMKLPVRRWPRGCFPDEYHWRDGVGPKKKKKKMINTHWGGVLEDNSFGTHEFMELCDQLGCETYINGNVGSGTVREMSEWVEYMTLDSDTDGPVSPMADLRKANGHDAAFPVNYFGVGNENWGCGGNMTAEYYANEYRRYQTYVRNYYNPKNPDKKNIYKIACGANAGDFEWTETLMKMAAPYMDGLSLHYYTVTHDWSHKGSATSFDLDEFYLTLSKCAYTEELLNKHGNIMDKYDPDKRIGLIFDEWGTWHDVEPGTNPGFLYQQNTMRDALVAGMSLNLFNSHCDRVKMANIAQLVNVLQSVILTEGDKMVLTPTYHVFKMFNVHQEASLVESVINCNKVGTEKNLVNQVYESASVDENGTLNITLTNLSATDSDEVEISLVEALVKDIKAEVLTDKMDAYNTFENPCAVTTKEFNDFKFDGGKIVVKMPACSIAALHVTLK